MVKKERYEGTLTALYKRNEKFLALSAVIFIISLFLGYFLAGILSVFLESTYQSLQRSIVQNELQLTTQSIFTHNLTAIFLIYGGGLLFGAFTAVFLIINGLLIGYVATTVPLGDFILLTLPHGIFEIPGLIIGGAAGFRLASFVYSYFNDILTETWYGSPMDKMTHVFWNNWDELKESLQLLAIAIILLIIAAFIEANLTLAWAQYFRGTL